jgi:hypothetical protein
MVGGFGHLFYHYGEDRDYTQRMKWLGIKLGFVVNTKMYHDREFRLSEDVFDYRKKMKYYINGCVARCSDINRPLMVSYLSSCIWTAKELTVYLTKHQIFSAPVLFVNVIWKLSATMSAILKYRRYITRKLKFPFLEFDQNV